MFWRKNAFLLVMAGCILFVVLTLVAMFFYRGGNQIDGTASGYSFFRNYFSELGLTQVRSGQPNTLSAVLFFTALTLAGAGLVLFFLFSPQFFNGSRRAKILSRLGSIFGVISGLCFIGVAFTPANLFIEPHKQFVLWAFQTFPIAAAFYTVAIFVERDYPNRFAFVFLVFTVLLVLYLLLLTFGKQVDALQGLEVQVTGQKVIGYASIISIFIQSWGAYQLVDDLQDTRP